MPWLLKGKLPSSEEKCIWALCKAVRLHPHIAATSCFPIRFVYFHFIKNNNLDLEKIIIVQHLPSLHVFFNYFTIHVTVLNHFKHQHDKFSRASRKFTKLYTIFDYFHLVFGNLVIISVLHIYSHCIFCGQCKMCFWPFWSILNIKINFCELCAHWLGCSQ